MDEPVSWKYYLATGLTAVIACFLSAVQGETGIFVRVREILIIIFQSEVHPLWVFVPTFLLGLAACWVERPKNSRSVLIAGLASFSLFGFTPYSSGKSNLEGRNAEGALVNNLVVKVQGLEAAPVEAGLVIRDQSFQIVRRVSPLRASMELHLSPPGSYWVGVDGAGFYRDVVHPVTLGDVPVLLNVVLERVGPWEGWWQKLKPAARGDRQP